MKKMLLLCCGLAFTAASKAQIIHVPADYPTIQQGINAANPGDTVLVADAIYYEQINFLGKKPLMVASEFLIDRDTSHINNTLMDGSLLTTLDSASVVYFISGEDSTSILCGFTIRHGKGTLYTAQGATRREGGGIFISSSGAKIQHNHITGNNLNNILLGNSNYIKGAGIGCEWKTDPHWVVVSDNVIDQNSCTSSDLGASGAGISICYNSRITGNTISGNTCTGTGTAFAVGAGFDCETELVPLNLITVLINHNGINNNNVTAQNNYATSAGGALGVATGIFSDNEVVNNVVNTGVGVTAGGSAIIFWTPRAGCVARNNIFSGNTSDLTTGGLAIETDPGQVMNRVLVENNYFLDNTGKDGGAFFLNGPPATLQNNVFLRNHATRFGGAVYCRPDVAASTEHRLALINNSFFGNTAANGGAIYTDGITVKPLIINSILWGDTAIFGTEIYLSWGFDTLEIANSVIDLALIHGHYRDGGANINSDPLFDETDTLNILPGSPACEAGLEAYACLNSEVFYAPQYDIRGLPRPWGSSYFDMGAYEYTDFTGMYVESTTKPAVFPNPFTNSVTISYTTEKAGPVLLQVFDNYGRFVAEPVNEFQPQGEQKVEWNAGNLPEGIYYCRLQADNQIYTNKSIKIR